jgi:hypothetical protein
LSLTVRARLQQKRWSEFPGGGSRKSRLLVNKDWLLGTARMSLFVAMALGPDENVKMEEVLAQGTVPARST